MFVKHPLIKPSTVEKRDYQEDLSKQCLKENILVVLPTGLGKTVIATLSIAEFLRLYPNRRCILLAPTRPLTYQHHRILQDHLAISMDDISAVTGEDNLESRKMKWRKKVVCATPQVARSDLDRGLLNLDELSLVIFDEAHRAVGNYAYTVLGLRLKNSNNETRIMGMTASLPHGESRVKEVLRSLSIDRIESRDHDSSDLKPYIQKTEIDWVTLTLPPVLEKIQVALKSALRKKLEPLRKIGLVRGRESVRFKILLEIRGKVRETGDPELWRSLLSSIRISHALNLLETQTLSSVVKFLEKQFVGVSRKGLVDDPLIQEAYESARGALKLGVEHPKLAKLKEILSQLKPMEKAIIFTGYRDSVDAVCSCLESVSLKVGRLIGKGHGGQSQRKQIQTLEDLKKDVFNILVATQVGEEGLDVAECRLVVFYDNVPSAVRFIQRKGRTGRVSPGRVIVFLTKGTRDEAYYWAGKNKMKRAKQLINNVEKKEGPLDKFVQVGKESPIVFVDSRETVLLINNLKKFGLRVEVQNLDVGDIVLSSDVVVERKTTGDFVKSIIDGRLFKQLVAMKETYPKPILLIEGDRKDIASVSKSSFFGALASVITDFQVSVVTSKGEEETAELISHIVRREQLEKKREVRVRASKKTSTTSDTQKYVVAGLPGINTVLAERILSKLNSLEIVFSSGIEDLKTVEGIGDKLAKRIREISSHSYNN